MKKIKIFISYSSADELYANLLVDDLKKIGVDVWFDKFEILVGHSITDKVYEGLANSDFVGVILTQNSVKSKWVSEELNYAKIRSITEGGRIILPLLFEECAIPSQIATLRYANFIQSYSDGFQELAKSLNISLLNTMPNPVARSFWDKVNAILTTHKVLRKKIPFDEANSQTDKEIKHHELSAWYSLIGSMRPSDAAIKYFHKTGVSEMREYEGDAFDTLVSDFSALTVAQSLKSALRAFDRYDGDVEAKRNNAIKIFKRDLMNRMYFTVNGIKHESNILAQIKEGFSLLTVLNDN